MLQPGYNDKLGDIRLVPQPVQFGGAERLSDMIAPTLGENTDAVLTGTLGLDPTYLSDLRNRKVI
jgi:CoA:oxalate CoA-transferase